MNTDDIIRAIAADAAARSPSLTQRVTVALAAGGLIAGAWFAQQLGVRPDIASALQTWRFATKVAIVLVCFAAALWTAVRLARPDADPRKTLGVLALPAVMLVLAIGVELAVSPASAWAVRAVGSNSRLCLMSIAVMSVAPLAGLLVALRAGAPRSPALAGAVAGLVAGSLGATLYAIHCIDDSPLFVALWYTPAIALAVLVGAAAGHRVLRW
jgi:hypothetical protein